MRCPLCDSPETQPSLASRDRFLETTPRLFRLSACRDCECLFIDPQPDAADLAAYYPKGYWRSGLGGKLGVVEAFYRRTALRDHVGFVRQAARRIHGGGKPLRLLDVGCGSGLLLDLIRRRGFTVTGVDVSASAARAAQVEHGLSVRIGSLRGARFDAESFDIVTMFHSLEHVTDPRASLSEARRVLQPNGRLIIQVPNIRSWQSRLLGGRWHGLDIPRHTIDYSLRSIHRLLGACGFALERVRNFNIRDNAPALASSVAPGLDPVRRKALDRTEPAVLAWSRHALYLALVGLAWPFALLEAAAGCGATIMVEARKA
jgi:SAM-dependent methyltransferase